MERISVLAPRTDPEHAVEGRVPEPRADRGARVGPRGLPRRGRQALLVPAPGHGGHDLGSGRTAPARPVVHGRRARQASRPAHRDARPCRHGGLSASSRGPHRYPSLGITTSAKAAAKAYPTGARLEPSGPFSRPALFATQGTPTEPLRSISRCARVATTQPMRCATPEAHGERQRCARNGKRSVHPTGRPAMRSRSARVCLWGDQGRSSSMRSFPRLGNRCAPAGGRNMKPDCGAPGRGTSGQTQMSCGIRQSNRLSSVGFGSAVESSLSRCQAVRGGQDPRTTMQR